MLSKKGEHFHHDEKVEEHKRERSHTAQASTLHSFAYGGRYTDHKLPKYKIPNNSSDPRCVYQVIKDELSLDGTPTLNMATFLTTWMEPEANQLLLDTAGKNYADMNCYPQTFEIQNRCVAMLAQLFNSQEEHDVTGTYCVGSTEGCMLGGLAMKKIWQKKRKEKGLDHYHPNIIMCSTVQVAWKKFAAFFDVEPRYVNISHDRFVIDTEEACKLVDENTIGIVMMLGSTYTGHFEPIEEMNNALLKLNGEKGFDVAVHVDAASGGFVAPFLYPDLLWDFRLPMVRSINVSGHKYGLTYPGAGWVLWRESKHLPKELIFELQYLGGTEETYTINFSRPSSQAVLQYYNFLRLGRDGYTKIIQNCKDNAEFLTKKLNEIGIFNILSTEETSLPLVAFKLNDNIQDYTVYDLSAKLKENGWIVPAYNMAEGAEDINILRVVVKEQFSKDLGVKLIHALKEAIKFYEEQEQKQEKKFKERIAMGENNDGKVGQSVC
jgi:glutamate decarboxylase